MVTQKDYTAEAVNAARSVLIELVHLLGEYWENNLSFFIGKWLSKGRMLTSRLICSPVSTREPVKATGIKRFKKDLHGK